MGFLFFCTAEVNPYDCSFCSPVFAVLSPPVVSDRSQMKKGELRKEDQKLIV